MTIKQKHDFVQKQIQLALCDDNDRLYEYWSDYYFEHVRPFINATTKF